MTSKRTQGGDRSNGWEAVAARLIAERARVGEGVVRNWSRALPAGGSVLDLGCGAGVPVSETLIDRGFRVFGIDASPSLVEAYRRRFPRAQVACEAAEDSDFFARTFDGIVAIGLLFLLPPDVQRTVIRRVASALAPRGRFLFTAPTQVATWTDLTTGRASISLGDSEYRRRLSDAALEVAGELVDEGENHFYDVVRAASLSL
jgi:cyclopropane fatty-acyl-phospholipid synthase-like methyltransferase